MGLHGSCWNFNVESSSIWWSWSDGGLPQQAPLGSSRAGQTKWLRDEHPVDNGKSRSPATKHASIGSPATKHASVPTGNACQTILLKQNEDHWRTLKNEVCFNGIWSTDQIQTWDCKTKLEHPPLLITSMVYECVTSFFSAKSNHVHRRFRDEKMLFACWRFAPFFLKWWQLNSNHQY